jgi:nitroreductase
MELKKAIKNRCSIRSFSKKELPAKIINEIIYYANLAPSAGNLQARDFVIINDKIVKEKLSAASLDQKFIVEAPICIIVCTNTKRIFSYGQRGKELYCIQDASAAVEHILLMALEYGLDTCWVGAFDENMVSKILKLPSYVRPVAIIPIGYANEQKKASERMHIDELTHHNQW